MEDERREYIRKLAEKLYGDLSFAAPEMWREQIARRLDEAFEEGRRVQREDQSENDD